MHTVLVIAGGLLLGSVFGLFGHLWGGAPTGVTTALRAFVPVWLVLTAANMWIGVSRAGYSVAQELPIQIVVFIIPAAVALGCLRLLFRKANSPYARVTQSQTLSRVAAPPKPGRSFIGLLYRGHSLRSMAA